MRLHRWLDAESAVAIETLLEELVHDIAVACVVLLQHAQLPLVRPRPVDKSSLLLFPRQRLFVIRLGTSAGRLSLEGGPSALRRLVLH